jgi:hypothetical protein
VSSETHTITVSVGGCEGEITFEAGHTMGEVRTALEMDLNIGDQVRYEVDLLGSKNSTMCTVSADGVTKEYVRATATPSGFPQCGCGTVETNELDCF